MAPVQGTNFFALGGRPVPEGFGWDPAFQATDYLEREAYESLFEPAPDGAVTGECSPGLLCQERSAARIAELAPEAKVVVLLRRPEARAYSHWRFNRKRTTEPLGTFREALEAEEERAAAGCHYRYRYVANGFYHDQVARFLDALPRERVGLFLYEDFRDEPAAFMARLFSFLDVDPSFEPDMSVRYNVSGVPRNRVAEGLLTLLRPVRSLLERILPARVLGPAGRLLLRQDAPDRELMAELASRYAEDEARLAALTGLDLSRWRDARAASGITPPVGPARTPEGSGAPPTAGAARTP